MITVKSFLETLTDSATIHQEVRNILRELDPDFPEEEEKFFNAVSLLLEQGNSFGLPGSEAFLIALEQTFASNIIYVGWLGFQFNLDCYRNPINKLRLKEDFEDLHLEHRMTALPTVHAARPVIEKYLRTIPADQQYMVRNIIDYYAYLQTTAYKLAHYFGFLLADGFLYYVVPGYANDLVLADQYTRKLKSFMEIDVSKIAGETIQNY